MKAPTAMDDDIGPFTMISEKRLDSRALGFDWLGPVLILGALGATLMACDKSPQATAQESEKTPSAAQPLAGPSETFDERAFTLRIKPSGAYAAGTPGKVEVELEAKAGFKCNQEYPYKFKVKDSPDVEYPAPVVKGDALRFVGKDKAVMTVPFTPKASGKKTIAGQFSFSVCTDEQCLVEKRDLTLQISVD
jgi:hypothetical protein